MDIGEAIVGTAAYFVLAGAQKVCAFEPFLNFYTLAKDNIKVNNLEGVYKMINIAVGGQSGHLSEDSNHSYIFGYDRL